MACLLASAPAWAATHPLPSTVTVSGSGTVSRDPDRATLALRIETNDDAAANATSANNRIYNALLERLRGDGISASAIKTASYELNFVPKPAANDSYKPPRTGFVVSRDLLVSIDNLPSVGSVIDAAVAGGVTQIISVNFGIRDDRKARAAALAAAVQDGAAQATAIAQAAHRHLGAIRRISTVQNTPVFTPRMMSVAASAAQPPTEITPSAIQVSATVTITYVLAP